MLAPSSAPVNESLDFGNSGAQGSGVKWVGIAALAAGALVAFAMALVVKWDDEEYALAPRSRR